MTISEKYGTFNSIGIFLITNYGHITKGLDDIHFYLMNKYECMDYLKDIDVDIFEKEISLVLLKNNI